MIMQQALYLPSHLSSLTVFFCGCPGTHQAGLGFRDPPASVCLLNAEINGKGTSHHCPARKGFLRRQTTQGITKSFCLVCKAVHVTLPWKHKVALAHRDINFLSCYFCVLEMEHRSSHVLGNAPPLSTLPFQHLVILYRTWGVQGLPKAYSQTSS